MWSDVYARSLTTEYARLDRSRAARWCTAPPIRSRARSASWISAFGQRDAIADTAPRLKLVEFPGPLESRVVSTDTASGFAGGSIPDHVVGAPLKDIPR